MNEKAGLAALPTLALVLMLALVGLAGAPAGALAQQDQGLAAARACTTISADAERLACYDRALRPARPAAAAVPRESTVQPETRRRRAAPKASAGANDEFEITVVEVRRRSRLADAVFVTDDGRIWRQTDDKHIIFPDPPFRAVVSPGSFGSHFLTPHGQRVSVRVSEERR